MTAFVESCVGTVADSAVAIERRARGKPRAEKLLRLLGDKKNILITTHEHPDPDALASATGMAHLLHATLQDAKVTIAIKGRIGGGLNEAFVRFSNFKSVAWDEATLPNYDAVLLLDTQPAFAFSPLPAGTLPFAVIDHHRARARARKLNCPFCDIRTEVGATSSIVFSYFMELEVPIRPDLGAMLLYGIESDLAGAAGAPGELDNIALSSLTLIADPRTLYKMRYVDLPQSYYTAYASGLAHAYFYDTALMSHLDAIDSLEKPAVIADFLLRFDKVQWALVSAVYKNQLMLSLRTSHAKQSAADIMRKLTLRLGQGGGHRTKAGGLIKLKTGSAAEIEKIRAIIRKRYLDVLGIPQSHGQKLVPEIQKVDAPKAAGSGRSSSAPAPMKLAASGI